MISSEADPFLISPDYTIEKFKTATRIVPANTTTVSSVDFALMEEIDEQGQEDDQADVIEAVETPEDGVVFLDRVALLLTHFQPILELLCALLHVSLFQLEFL